MNYSLDFDNWLDSDFITEILENIVNLYLVFLASMHNETILMIFQQSADLWNNVAKYGIWDLFVKPEWIPAILTVKCKYLIIF